MVKSILVDALHTRLQACVRDLGSLPESVWKRTGALNTWGTNAIEGNTLDREDVEAVLLQQQGAPGRPMPDVVETIQHERAFEALLAHRKEPIRLVTPLELHEQVFAGSPRHLPGQWRRSNVRIAGMAHRPPPAARVVPAMEAWAGEIATPVDDLWLGAARMHQTFEEIHPFEDGNGRVGRLLLNLWLLQHGWPPLHITPADRDTYLDALRAGNREEHEPLAAFLRDAMARSLLDLLDQVGDEDDLLVPLAEVADAAGTSAGYLALRARQGALPAIHADQTSAPPQAMRHRGRPRWLTSRFAIALWAKHHRRNP